MNAANLRADARAQCFTQRDEAAILLEDGYVILRDVLTLSQILHLRAELDSHFATTPRCEGDFYGWKTTRMGSVLDKAPSTIGLVLNEAILRIVEAVLKPYCDYVQLNLVQAVRVHPGERRQAPHRDEEMWPAAKHGTPWLINVMWAIDDFTADNGATRIWPGSHQGDLDRFMDESDAIAAEMPAGSVCIFLGSLTHGAGANQTFSDRTGIIVSYCLGWLRTYENQFLSYPPSLVKTFPPQLQTLLGYKIHRPNLGGWNGQDPSLVLQNKRKPPAHIDALPEAILAELKAYYSEGVSS